MNRIAFADKTGIFAWSDVRNCRDTLPQRDAASRFIALVFSKFNTDAISLNGRMTGATCEFELNRDIPNDWYLRPKMKTVQYGSKFRHICVWFQNNLAEVLPSCDSLYGVENRLASNYGRDKL